MSNAASIGGRRARLAAIATIAPEERMLAGSVNGVLHLIAGLTLALFFVLPGAPHHHPVALLVTAGLPLVWGAICLLLIDWRELPASLFHLITIMAFAGIAVTVATSGGAASPAWIYLFLVALFAAYFFAPPIAGGYLAGCAIILALPLLYDPAATHDAFLGQLVIALAAFVGLGGAIIAGKSLMWSLRHRAEQLAAEQGSLRRVATAVVEGAPAERIYHLAAEESARLLRSGSAWILRVEGGAKAVVMGSWADQQGAYEPGMAIQIVPDGTIGRALATGKPVRVENHGADSGIGRLGYGSSIIAPVRVAGRTWGVLAVAAAEPTRLVAADEERLVAFGDLLATSITSIEDRAKLADQAASDPLTGLANHRTLQQRLIAEAARAVRHGEPVSVAVLDIDHFKQLNDSGGHETGDDILVRVARCLKNVARAEDTLGRVGGDEFAWILPKTTRQQALVAVERARRAVASAAPAPFRISLSAGICDTSVTNDPAQLVRLADDALYWSKANGRDRCWVYDSEVVAELSAQERAERLERSQVLLGLRALARAIDAKDPATREHSERVAHLVGKLARARGWSHEQTVLLSEAALLHDVGKIGRPEPTPAHTDPLSPHEWAPLADDAELSARIVEGVLIPDQVEWIRSRGERLDADGRPDRTAAEEISEGAALLALADAWDVMMSGGPDSAPKPVEDALAECESLVGQQFTRAAVTALQQLYESGELPPQDSVPPSRATVEGGSG